MSAGTSILIVVAVLIAIAIVIGLVLRSRHQRRNASRMRLPELGALSTTGLDKEHASERHVESPHATPSARQQTPRET